MLNEFCSSNNMNWRLKERNALNFLLFFKFESIRNVQYLNIFEPSNLKESENHKEIKF